MFSFFLLSEQSSRISSIVFSVGKHALQKTAYLLNQTFYSFAVYIKAYIYGNIFGVTHKSIRRILQPEKRLRDERYS